MAGLQPPSGLSHEAGIRDMREVLGAEVQVDWTPPPVHLSSLQQAALRASVRLRVHSCRNCALGPGEPLSVATRPVPLRLVDLGHRAGSTLTCAVLGEAPGAEEDAYNIGFVGKSGKLLRVLLRDAGFGQAWMLNRVCCRPPENRTPARGEVEACAPNLAAQMSALVESGVNHVLLVGATATAAWRPDLKVTSAHGAVGVWRQYQALVMPCIHPAAALRQRAYVDTIRYDLSRWAEVVRSTRELGASGGLEYLAQGCVRCGRGYDFIDADGLAWCPAHVERYNPPSPKRAKGGGRSRRPGPGQLGLGGDGELGDDSEPDDAKPGFRYEP